MSHELHEECGVFGVYSPTSRNVAQDAYLALYALQHRGQESCGIAVNDDGLFTFHKDVGLVPEVFSHQTIEKLGEGQIAVGHVRYSTTGIPRRVNAQPLVVRHIKGSMALCHNGNIVNALPLKQSLELEGAIFQTTSDSEVIAHTIVKERLSTPSIEKALEQAMYKLQGAYSLIIMSPKKLIAARDPNGFRPLVLGKKGDRYYFASESCALDSLGAELIRDIKPGEIVVIGEEGITCVETHCSGKHSLCVFEFVYFARPDSIIEGSSVHKARQRAGAYLALEHPVHADVVIGVPDSGLDAALGYAQQSGIPYGTGFIKNRYIGRTFIQPVQGMRENSVRIKLNVIKDTVKDKRVVLIDDSIVRGTTSARIVNLLKDAGATQVHMRVSAPPFISPCYFGTDIDSKDKLIACKMSLPEIRDSIGVDSLGFLSVNSVNHIAEGARCGFCDGCFTGEYPVSVDTAASNKDKFEYRISESE